VASPPGITPVGTDWAERVRSLRGRLGLTQVELAEAMKVSFATVNRWENGKTSPSSMAMTLIERAERVGMDAFRATVPSAPALAVPVPTLPFGPDFGGDPEVLQLVTEAERLSYGHLFSPAFASETSRIDALPHQRIAVYWHLLEQPRLRFLLADDAGAGKTIMTGLYIREMLNRRLLNRVLVVPPAGLVGNWRRELQRFFSLSFKILSGRDAANDANPFTGPGSDLVIVSLDTLRQPRMFERLQDPAVEPYELVVFDEAHKLAAYVESDLSERKTDRYRLAEALAGIPSEERWALPWEPLHLLLLTATPHMGKDDPYFYLWRLLEPEVLTTPDSFERYPEDARGRHFLRRTKEEMVRFDGSPLYQPRTSDTLSYDLTAGEVSEQALYDQTTRYIASYYNRARFLNRSAARLAMSVFQRRLVSSSYALLRSLERRHEKITAWIDDLESGRIDEQQLLARQRHLDERARDILDETTADEESGERGEEQHDVEESELLAAVTALSLAELQVEREELDQLLDLARKVFEKGDESKFERLRDVLQDQAHRHEKFIVFTEHRDTLDFLVRRLEGLGYTGRVASIHGGLRFDERERQVEFFRREGESGARFLVATDAAGEGINLQFCRLMVNYDIPWNPARLEQRMGRIHRYGQQHPVVITNLLAGKTREGRVIQALLQKLERIRAQLGSDKVFDVVGRLFSGISLTSYMAQVAMGDSVEEVLQEVTKKVSLDDVKKVEEKERRIYGDRNEVRDLLPKLRAELDQDELRHLLPGYVLRFVQRAAAQLDLGIEGEVDETFSFEPLRRGSLDPLLPALEAYPAEARNRLTVTRPSVDAPAVFLRPGEPVFDRLKSYVCERFTDDVTRGAVFVDPVAAAPYLFHLAVVDVVRRAEPGHDRFAKRQIIESRLVGLRQTDDQVEEAPVEHLLMLRGATKPSGPPLATPVPELLRVAQTYADSAVGGRLAESRRTVLAQTNETREAATRRGYDFLEGDLAARRSRISERARAGDSRARAALDTLKERQRRIRDERMAALKALRHEPDLVEPGRARFIAHALVLPSSDPEERRRYDERVEHEAVRIVTAYEESYGARVVDVSTPARAQAAGLNDWPGFDLLSHRPGGRRLAIEVKGRAQVGAVELTENEWAKAATLRKDYWLYVVFGVAAPHATTPVRVRDPFGRLLGQPKGGVVIEASEILSAGETFDE